MNGKNDWRSPLLDSLREAGCGEDLVEKVDVVCEYATLLNRFATMLPHAEVGDVVVDKVTITPARNRQNGEVLMVVRGTQGKGKAARAVVTFHSGPALPELLYTWLHRVWTNQLNWREDQPWTPSDARDEPEKLPSLESL